MGTAGAYGGTGGRPWRDVRDLFDDLASSHGGGGGDSDSGDRDDVEYQDGGPLSDDLSAIGNALAIALSTDDPALDGPPSGLPIGSLLPVRRERGGGGGGGVIGGSLRGESSATGRTGQGSTRSVARSAARGGVAIGGAYALRFGDRSALAELGLDLEELRSLGPRSQCARILDAVLGEAGHPDETALRAAAAEQLKAIVMLETPPSEADALREFVAAYVFQMGLIELRSDLASGAIDVSAASRTEKRIRRYIRTRVMQLDVPAGGSMRIADISAHAERLVGEAIGLLRAR
jgi:hypothetical protein